MARDGESAAQAAHLDFRPCRHTIGRLHEELPARGRHVTVPAHIMDSAHPDNDVPAIHEFSDSLGLPTQI